MTDPYVSVARENGQLAAQMTKIFLESCGISAITIGESAGTAYGMTVGSLGEVEILVPADQAEEAMRLLEAVQNGEMEMPTLKPKEGSEG